MATIVHSKVAVTEALSLELRWQGEDIPLVAQQCFSSTPRNLVERAGPFFKEAEKMINTSLPIQM